ncbi:MAG TPA: Gfo/Idh/MocA family oxidoreductase [Bacteroidota bacterium]|nr:Gfo/Idh/MocA family oxidoreductase [Bacteroidota bacterium]
MSLRGAIIGLGNIAVRGHVPALLSPSVARRASVIAVADVVEENRRKVPGLFPGAAVYADIGQLLDAEKPGFVDICTPPHTHRGILELCAARGIHAVCEKPLMESYAAVEELAGVISRAGIVFVPCHQYKYSPLWKGIRDVLKSGRLGRVTLAQFNVYRMQADTGTAGWNPAWRINRQQSGGGILADTGAHYFYLAQYFFGLPEKIFTLLRTLKHDDYTVEDTALVTLEYSRHLMQVNLTWAAGQRANSVAIAGTGGNLLYDGSRMTVSTPEGTAEIPMPDVSDKNQYISWYEALFTEFFDRIEAGNRSTDLLDEARHVMKMLHLSSVSSGQGSAVVYR